MNEICEKCKSWTRRYNTLSRRIIELEAEIKKLHIEILYHKEVNENVEQAFHINKEIMRNAIGSDNESRQHMAEEIELLKNEIKKLKG